MAGETITIEDNGDGTFDVTVGGDADSGPDDQDDSQPQTFHSVADVLAFVKEELSETDSSGPAMWQQEAAKRGGAQAQGQPSAAGAASPIQSM